MSQIAERVGLPKSTVSRLLSTLQALGAVEQVSAGGEYRVGEALVELASAALPVRSLADIARPHVQDLVNSLGEAAGLSVLDGDAVVYLDNVESKHAVQIRDWTGERLPLHVVSSGLVLLAHAPPSVIEDYLHGPLERFTPRTMVDPVKLRKRLDADPRPPDRVGARGVRRRPQLGRRPGPGRRRPGRRGTARPRAVVPVPAAG